MFVRHFHDGILPEGERGDTRRSRNCGGVGCRGNRTSRRFPALVNHDSLIRPGRREQKIPSFALAEPLQVKCNGLDLRVIFEMLQQRDLVNDRLVADGNWRSNSDVPLGELGEKLVCQDAPRCAYQRNIPSKAPACTAQKV